MSSNWKYISYRVKVLLSLSFSIFWILWFIELYKDISNNNIGIFLVLEGIFLFIITLFMIMKIAIPYNRLKKNMELFLLGYTNSGLKNNEEALSPEMEQVFATVVRVIESGEMLSANKKQAQYLALQNQINPHFLYNTLENIRSEALFEGNESVANMTEALSTFFRYTMSNVENLVTLREELENVNIYFSIQKHRFEERIHLIINCEDDEKCLDYYIPKLTLQPIVENSIIHGLEKKVGKGTVTIIIRCTEKRLIIQISDDGIGMSQTNLEKMNSRLNTPVFESIQLSKEKEGIAIINVSNRIHLLFGEEYGITMYSMPDKGTDTIINLPIVKSGKREQRDRFEKRNTENGENHLY